MPLYAPNPFDLADNLRYAPPLSVVVLVEWASREGFEAFPADPEPEDLHPRRAYNTRNHPSRTYEKPENLGSILGHR